MSLSKKDKAAVKALWAKISGATEAIGGDTLARLFACYPQTKIYFSHWPSLAAGSASLRTHGKTIIGGVGLAVETIEDMNAGLLDLSEKHAFQLKVDPSNFKFLAHCLMVVIATMFPDDFPAETQVSFDKFMVNVALALSEKFR